MTPSELRELADALAKGTHFVDSPELHAAMQSAADYLRACADAQPAGWTDRHTSVTRFALWCFINDAYARANYAARSISREPVENVAKFQDDAKTAEEARAMLAAAPAAPQAEPKREPSEKQIADACLRYRHDFGLLDKYERDCIVNEAWRWADAFGIGGSDAE